MLIQRLLLPALLLPLAVSCTKKDEPKHEAAAPTSETIDQNIDLAQVNAEIDRLKAEIEANVTTIEELKSADKDNSAKIEELEKENASLIVQITAKEKELSLALDKKSKLELDIVSLETEIAEAKQKIASLTAGGATNVPAFGELKAKISDLEASLTAKNAELEALKQETADLQVVIDSLMQENGMLKEVSVQKFLYGLRKNRLFVAGSSELAIRFKPYANHNCVSILSFANNTTDREVARVPAGYKLDYQRMFICQEEGGKIKYMNESGVLTNFLNSRKQQVTLLIAENQSCKPGEDEETFFGGYIQTFRPFDFEVGGYETVSLWPSTTTERFAQLVEHNMASTLPGVYSESCTEAMSQNAVNPLVKTACEIFAGTAPEASEKGCFTSSEINLGETANITFKKQ